MAGLIRLRDAVIAGLKEAVPGLNSVDPVRGSITQDGLRRISVRSPGALVAVLGVRSFMAADTGIYRADVVLSAFLITSGQQRLDEGHSLVEAVMLAVAGNLWGLTHTGFPTDIDAEPIYDDRPTQTEERNRHLQETGTFLQAVSWRQTTRVERTLPVTGEGRPDDRAQADALGQRTDGTVWPEEISTVIDHPGGYR